MSNNLEVENVLNPVTALSLLRLNRLYMLTGEGQYLKIFEHRTHALLGKHRIFESEAIHGITCLVDDTKKLDIGAKVLLWGGRSICLIDISYDSSAPRKPLDFSIALAEIRTNDWILDGRIKPFDSRADEILGARFEAVFVTAHNELHRLRVSGVHSTQMQDGNRSQNSALPRTSRCGSGPKGMLYSAHISWSREDHAEGRILIAAGTIFGEVHLWTFEYDSVCDQTRNCHHYTFTGHLGSIFGVRISQEVNIRDSSVTRLLASCSDDRTIRVWDISDLKNHPRIELSTQCLATIIGHASRIWAVRFVYSTEGTQQLLSFGEDGTTQKWFLESASTKKQDKHLYVNTSCKLTHHSRYDYHSGKNIWASAIIEGENGTWLIATGGADGCVVSYRAIVADSIADTQPTSLDCTMEQAVECMKGLEALSRALTKNAIFDALHGRWHLSRTIRSAITTYPSGKLTGIANFTRRPATDYGFDEEYLFSEEGDFATEKGLNMKATRQYVYRYQQQNEKMTVWFVKTEDRGIVDYLFHQLDFAKDQEKCLHEMSDTQQIDVTATGHHLCNHDDYVADYKFTFVGKTMKQWSVKYTVKGPHKDYVADAKFSRPSPEDLWVHVDASAKRPLKSIGDVQRKPSKADSFKSYAWISNTEFLTTTEQGNVYLGTVNMDPSVDESHPKTSVLSWESIGSYGNLISSSIITSIPTLGIAFLVDTSGKVFRYQHQTKILKFCVARQKRPAYLKVQEISSSGSEDERNWGKAFSFANQSKSRHWLSLIATSLASDEMVISLHPLNEDNIQGDDDQWSIQLPKGFIVTSSLLLDTAMLVILGSRNGDLLIYDTLRRRCKIGTSSSVTISPKIHGQEAVTNIRPLPALGSRFQPGNSYILTTGRDGRYAIHQINYFEVELRYQKPKLETLHESTLPFGPNIEGLCFDSTNNELFLWGFRNKHFIVWNETKKTEVMTVECGGAHRHWAYSPQGDGKGGGSFVWTKASICKIYTQIEASHRVLQPGGHGREIKALAVSPKPERFNGSLQRFVATGAEDTAIRIFKYEPETGFDCFCILTKHTTGLQKLQWSGTHSQYLFSAAGCEEFFIWKTVSVPHFGMGIIRVLVCPTVTKDKDLRIMDFAVLDVRSTGSAAVDNTNSVQLISMVYSDSSVRIFAFRNTPHRGYTLDILLEGFYTTHCLTQVTFIHLATEVYLCTASTDGHLAFWPLKDVLTDHGFYIDDGVLISYDSDTDPEGPAKKLSMQKRIPIHQSSIKSLIQVQLSTYSYLIVTGGDDQALAWTHITTQDATSAESGPMHASLALPNAHASAVTALSFLGGQSVGMRIIYRFASIGNDQRLKTWDLTDTMRGGGVGRFNLRRTADMHTSVADASALEAFGYPDDGSSRLCVAGVGMEDWIVKKVSLEE